MHPAAIISARREILPVTNMCTHTQLPGIVQSMRAAVSDQMWSLLCNDNHAAVNSHAGNDATACADVGGAAADHDERHG